MYAEFLAPVGAAVLGALWTFGMFFVPIVRRLAAESTPGAGGATPGLAAGLVRNDRFWAGLQCALAVFMMYYFY